MDANRLQQQIEFIVEIDQLKHVFRRSKLIDKSRYENDAEHSWHLAMMAIILSENANEKELNIIRVLKMLLIHDLVEIDAGDTFAYDEKGHEDKQQREEVAAERLFGLLPKDQGEEFYRLWKEFEERETPEAQFATTLDKLQPLLHNYFTEGATWKEHGITSEQVFSKNKHIKNGSKALWEFAEGLINKSVEKGYLRP